jgi:hypothetical protein
MLRPPSSSCQRLAIDCRQGRHDTFHGAEGQRRQNLRCLSDVAGGPIPTPTALGEDVRVKIDHEVLDALLDSVRGVLPGGVTVERVGEGGIRVSGRGAYVAGPGIGGLPLPKELRLRFAIRGRLQAVADGVTRVSREPWPAEGVSPHVRISGQLVEMWFGPKRGGPEVAVLRLPPFRRPD